MYSIIISELSRQVASCLDWSWVFGLARRLIMREIVVNGRFLSRRVTGVERYRREIIAFFGNRCRVEDARQWFDGTCLGTVYTPEQIRTQINLMVTGKYRAPDDS